MRSNEIKETLQITWIEEDPIMTKERLALLKNYIEKHPKKVKEIVQKWEPNQKTFYEELL